MFGKIVLAGAVLGIVPIASATFIVNSFETDAELYPATANHSGVARNSSLGVTNGSSSMAVTTGVVNPQWLWSSKTYDANTYTQWKNHKTLKIDLHVPASETGARQINFAIAIDSPGVAWHQYHPLNWLWQNQGVAYTTTITWDLSALTEWQTAPATDTELTIPIMTVEMNAASRPTTYYIDNLRFEDAVPEPTFLGLIGLGVVGLLRRRA